VEVKRARRGEAGFTLIELMVAVALSGIVIGFVFQIHNQMVGALRGQANLSEVVETVTAAREMMAREIRLAGMGFPASGVKFGATNDIDVWRGVDAINDVDGGGVNDVVDQLMIQRTDSDLKDVVAVDADPNWFFPLVDADDLFNTVDPLMLANDLLTTGCAPVATVVDATGVTIPKAQFAIGTPCEPLSGIAANDAMKLATIRRISFRLDPVPARLELGVLQRSLNGGAWEDIGIGFSNFQVAIRYFEGQTTAPLVPDVTDLDGDGDPTRDWYSGDSMEIANGRPVQGAPMQVTISIEGRNIRRLDNLSSTMTPGYTVVGMENYNSLGDFGVACGGCQYDPAGVPDLSAGGLPARYGFPGHVYRSSTTTVWLRSRLESL
jgi:prepilin-type N-terminal cleavage/methylation domain-containing protein